MIIYGSVLAQALLEVTENQNNENLTSDFDSVPQDLLLEDVLEEDEDEDEEEELSDDQPDIAVGAEAFRDDDATDFSGTGINRDFNLLSLTLKLFE